MKHAISRRQVLSWGALASSRALFGLVTFACRRRPPRPNDPTEPTSTRADIVIVGAGVAGLAAAQEFATAGVRAIVLEGRDRVGGRVWTDRSWPGIPVDLGASWIHGVKRNPIARLASQCLARTVSTDYGSFTLFGADGRRVTRAEKAAVVLAWRKLSKAIEAEQDRRLAAGEPDVSVGDVIRRNPAYLTLGEAERRQLDWATNTRIEHEYAADVASLSLLHYDDDLAFPGKDVVLPEGYDVITQSLSTGIDVRLEHVVKHIRTTDRGVTVETNIDTFEADRVLVTLPVGVLKSGTVRFTPNLRERKELAIARFGSSVLNKVCLRFSTPFWAADDTDLLEYIAERRGQWGETLNLYKSTRRPVLMLFNAGTFGAAIETMTDAAVVESAMTPLRAMYGAATPDPVAWIVTRWGSDPFAQGSYAHVRPGSSGADCDALAEPESRRLFFAGEATHRKYRGTVHGAYLSGRREAKRILKNV